MSRCGWGAELTWCRGAGRHRGVMWSGSAPVCLLCLILFWTVFFFSRGGWNSHVTLFTSDWLAERERRHFPSSCWVSQCNSSPQRLPNPSLPPLASSSFTYVRAPNPPTNHTCKWTPLCGHLGPSVAFKTYWSSRSMQHNKWCIYIHGSCERNNNSLTHKLMLVSRLVYTEWAGRCLFFKGTDLLPDLCVTLRPPPSPGHPYISEIMTL